MKVSTRARYGMRAMVEVAREYDAGAISVREVARRQRLSVKYLEQIMSPLKAAGLVTAARGVHGGYALTRHPREIRLSEIYDALDGAPAVVECLAAGHPCAMKSKCPTRGLWARMNEALKNVLEGATLAEILAESPHTASKASSR